MTDGKQGAAEWLRGIIDEYKANGRCHSMAKMFGIECRYETCQNCRTKMLTAIADRIDAERALPEGMEWPRFEDGGLVKVGDEVEFEGEAAKVLDVAFSAVRFSIGVGTATASRRVYCDLGESVKRPAPKVLDADGVPIKVGDTVYFVDGDARPLTVERIDANGGEPAVDLVYAGQILRWHSVNPEKLTHERPDSWEKLEKDARKTACDYALAPRDEDGLTTCDGCRFQKSESCSNEMTLDVVERAKKLAGIEEEAQR